MPARMSASRPGAGSSTSVRIDRMRPQQACGTARPRPGTAGSARRAGAGSGRAGARPPAAAASSSVRSSHCTICPYLPSPREAAGPVASPCIGRLVVASPGGRTAARAACGGPGGAAPWPPTRRCRARRRSTRGACRRRRAGRRPPGGGRAGRRAPPAAGRAGRSASARSCGSWSGRVSATGGRRRARRGDAGPAAEVGRRAVGRDAVQPRRELRVAAEAPEPSVGPEVRLLHHVPRILLVTGQAVGERVGVRVGRANQLVERLPVAVLGGGDQVGHVLWHRLVRPSASGRCYVAISRRFADPGAVAPRRRPHPEAGPSASIWLRAS